MADHSRSADDTISLPAPRLRGRLSLEETLARRRSVREFRDQPLQPAELSQLLWALQGITEPGEGFRTAPSAGALYPLEIYLATADGLFHYLPAEHCLRTVSDVDLRLAITRASLDQEVLREAAALFVMAAVYRRTEQKYGREDSALYVPLDAGHAAQNLLLQAVSLGLGAVPIGAFDAERLKTTLSLPGDHRPLYLLAVGRPR